MLGWLFVPDIVSGVLINVSERSAVQRGFLLC